MVSALNVLCSKGDSVLLHSPTYIGFTKSLTNNGYHIVHSPLVKDENNVYRMDFEDMEKKIVEGLKQLDGAAKEDATAFIYPLHPTPNVKQPIPDRIIQSAAQKPATEHADIAKKDEPSAAPTGQSMELPLSGNLETVISALTAIYGKDPNKVITIKVQL